MLLFEGKLREALAAFEQAVALHAEEPALRWVTLELIVITALALLDTERAAEAIAGLGGESCLPVVRFRGHRARAFLALCEGEPAMAVTCFAAGDAELGAIGSPNEKLDVRLGQALALAMLGKRAAVEARLAEAQDLAEELGHARARRLLGFFRAWSRLELALAGGGEAAELEQAREELRELDLAKPPMEVVSLSGLFRQRLLASPLAELGTALQRP